MSEPKRIPPKAIATVTNMKAQMAMYLQGVLDGMGIEWLLGWAMMA